MEGNKDKTKGSEREVGGKEEEEENHRVNGEGRARENTVVGGKWI